jgi:hypothetical protein
VAATGEGRPHTYVAARHCMHVVFSHRVVGSCEANFAPRRPMSGVALSAPFGRSDHQGCQDCAARWREELMRACVRVGRAQVLCHR